MSVTISCIQHENTLHCGVRYISVIQYLVSPSDVAGMREQEYFLVILVCTCMMEVNGFLMRFAAERRDTISN